MTAYHDMIRDQLDEELRELHHLANQLMHEIATEVWRTAGGDKREVQGKLIQSLSRTRRSEALIAHTDERFQTLAVRTAGWRTPEHGRRGHAPDAGADRALGGRAGRGRERPRRDGDRPASGRAHRADARSPSRPSPTATARSPRPWSCACASTASSSRTRPPASRALESYVQQGVETMGMLAGSVEARAYAGTGDDEVAGRLNRAVEISSMRSTTACAPSASASAPRSPPSPRPSSGCSRRPTRATARSPSSSS